MINKNKNKNKQKIRSKEVSISVLLLDLSISNEMKLIFFILFVCFLCQVTDFLTLEKFNNFANRNESTSVYSERTIPHISCTKTIQITAITLKILQKLEALKLSNRY